ncbi:hypothetical protein [Pectobacterium fontis]|uniref:Glycosyltransferase n=1 Tax=Pectobacterium fontis TaxID=2558042 RepID=A0A7V8IJX2_9GAMM|nr:hypothetical protein [Pectobacterium fontis]KHN53083.1 hypothetical protein OI69_07020 [Pectobacterium fontis]
MKISCVVIIYNSMLQNSDTLKSLTKCKTDGIDLDILVWNNGQELLIEEDINNFMMVCQENKISAKIYQDITNISLSKIYNFFIDNFSFDIVTLLDQDSKIPNDFFYKINNSEKSDIYIPKIIVNNNEKDVQYYPHLYDNPNIVIDEGYISSPVISAMSGVSMSKIAIDKIIKERGFIFEERLALYGIDNDFFRTIKKMSIQKLSLYCVNEIHHSLSTLDPKEEKSDFRIIENLYFKYFIRIEYQKKSLFSTIFICIRDFIFKKTNFSQMKNIILFLIKKHHPRSIKNISRDKKPSHYTKKIS